MAHAFESVVFYRCSHCGNVVAKVIDQGVPLVCCGEPMKALKPGTSDGAVEKHLPVVQLKDGSVHVQVGSAVHPMLEAHYIQFICLVTDKGVYFRNLRPEQAPEADFAIGNEKPLAVYEYCNLHGLWVTEL